MNLNSDLFSTSSQSEILKTSWTCCIYIQNVQRLPKKKLKSFRVMQLATWSASSPLVTTLTSSPSTVFLAQSAPACSTGLLDVPWVLQAHSHPRAFVPAELLSRMTSSLLSHCPAFVLFNYFLQSHLLKESFLITKSENLPSPNIHILLSSLLLPLGHHLTLYIFYLFI